MALALAFLLPVLAPVAAASPTQPRYVAPPGLETPIGFVTLDDLFFVQVGSPVFGLAFNPVPNGSQIFSDYLTIYLYPLTNATHTAYLSLFRGQSSQAVAASDVIVTSDQVGEVNLPVPPSSNYILLRLVVDGTVVWYYTETPIQILPLPGLLVGGIDLVAIIALVEFLVIGLPLMALAQRIAKKAIHFPRMKAILWLHGIVLGGLAYWIFQFPALNVFFGGWEWIVFPLPTLAFLFFWELGRHNRDEAVMVLRGNPRSGHRLGFDWWTIHTHTDRQGNLELIGQLWRDGFFRATGHRMPIFLRNAETLALEPVPATLLRRHVGNTVDDLRALFDDPDHPKAPRGSPGEDFEVTNRRIVGDEDDTPARLYFVSSLDPFEIVWPHVSFHRDVPPTALDRLAPRLDETGTPRRKLSFPHVVPGRCTIRLAPLHYADVWSVALGWRQAEDLEKVNEEQALELWVTKSRIHRLAEAKAAPRLAAHIDLLSRPLDDLSPVDAAAYVEAKRGDPRRLRDDRGGGSVDEPGAGAGE